MALTEREKTVIKDLQTQEQGCIDKYSKYHGEAKDTVLKDLFDTLEKKEEQHYSTLQQLLNGEVPSCDCNDSEGKEYNPEATYSKEESSQDKTHDCYLATDAIGTEKLISTDYNTNVFSFGQSDIRKTLADIQIEEQNHAEMLHKYKEVNGMK